MVEIINYKGRTIKVPTPLYKDLYNLCYIMIKQEMDVLILLDGYEGTGKSYLARGLGFVISYIIEKITGQPHNFDANNIQFDLNEYVKSSFYGQPFHINLLDESRKVANKLRSNSKEAVKFTNYLSECRSKQQVHIVLLPAFHDLVKYIVLWRMSFLIHVKKKYKTEFFQDQEMLSLDRGEFHVYSDRDAIKYAYMNPYKYPNRTDYWARWTAEEVFSDEELQKYKDNKEKFMGLKYLAEDEDDNVTGEELTPKQFKVLEYLKQKLRVPDIALTTNNTEKYIRDVIKQLKKKGYNIKPIKQIGSNKIEYYEIS